MKKPRDWTQVQIRAWWKDTKKKYAVGDALTPEDTEIFMDLLTRHPSCEKKIGAGVERVLIRTGQFGEGGYSIERVDGSSELVGIKPIVTRRRYSVRELLYEKACRRAIAGEVMTFRDSQFFGEKDCPECGVRLVWNDGGDSKRKDVAQVDHAPPWRFVLIVDAWLEVEGVRVEDFREDHFVDSDDGAYRFADDTIAELFRVFHNLRAVLRLLCRGCNGSRKRS